MEQELYKIELQRDTGYISVTSSINRITITQKIIIRQAQVGEQLSEVEKKKDKKIKDL